MLIERDNQVEVLGELLDAAAAGSGRLVFVGGEAGVGKTTLAASFIGSVSSDVTVRRGACDNVTTAAALGPFIEALPEIVDRPSDESPGSRHDLFRSVREHLCAAPTLLLIEDVHWADEATLDMLRFLGRRLNGVPLLIVATFRADEVDALHPLSLVLGDLATSAGVVRLRVPPLSVDGVRTLLSGSDSRLDAAQLHAQTAGNPFYVTEVLAGAADAVPETVRDAVLARAERLSPGARRVLDAMSVLCSQADLDLLEAVAGVGVHDVDECVRRGVLVSDGDSLRFRHELARLTIETALSHADRIVHHSRVLEKLMQRGSTDDRRLAYHAAACGDRYTVKLHAPRAAALAGSRGAHREAAQQYQVALRYRARLRRPRCAARVTVV